MKTNLDIFWYWINERERIRIKKEDQQQIRPWTDDKILQTYKFTNVFRQDDKTTKALLLHLLPADKNEQIEPSILIFNIILFRMFNWPDTYLTCGGWNDNYDITEHKKQLRGMAKQGKKVFTGAYIISNFGRTDPKIDVVAECVNTAWQNKNMLADSILEGNSIECAVNTLSNTVMGASGFVAYEFACDMTYCQRLLKYAEDTTTWGNPGPGARRGLNRILRNRKGAKPLEKSQHLEEMQWLFSQTDTHLKRHVHRSEHPVDMRVIENALCEVDKYLRVQTGEGRPRSRYK